MVYSQVVHLFFMRIQVISVCGFLFNTNKLLIAKRAIGEDFMPNEWELVGGGVDFGEDVESALKREFREEMGLEVVPVVPYFTKAFSHREDGFEKHEIEIDYFVRLDPTNQIPVLRPDIHSEFRWVDQIEAKEIMHSKHPASQLESAMRGFAMAHLFFDINND